MEDARGEREDDGGEEEDELGAEQDLLEVVEEPPQRRAGDLAEEGEVGLLAERGGARRRQLTLLGCSRRGKEHEEAEGKGICDYKLTPRDMKGKEKKKFKCWSTFPL